MTFSATEAAFEGFRIVRRHPLAIVFWALAYVIFFGAFLGLFAGPLASVMATTEAMEGTQPSPQEAQALMASWSGFIVLGVPLSLVLGAVLNAAVAVTSCAFWRSPSFSASSSLPRRSCCSSSSAWWQAWQVRPERASAFWSVSFWGSEPWVC